MNSVTRLIVIVVFVVTSVGCGGKDPVSQSIIGSNPNLTSPTPVNPTNEYVDEGFGIMSPLGLSHQTTAASASKDGDQYESDWPNQLIGASGNGSLNYNPQCEEPDPPFGDMSFAIYNLIVPEQADYYTISFDWQSTDQDYNDLWLGLSNFDSNAWDWQQGQDNDEILFPAQDYVNGDSQVYLAVVCLGNTQWELNQLTTSSVQLAIESVSPLAGDPGEMVTFSAVVFGGIPGEDTYSWDFGGGATPNTSTDISPTVTTGTVGNYTCMLDVSNQYSSDQFVFMLVVGNPPVADLTADPTITFPVTPVFLDATGSTDTDGSVVQYDWDWDSDGNYEIEDGSATELHSYMNPGVVTTTVRVWDNDGASDTASVEIEVISFQPPEMVVLPEVCGSNISELQLLPFDPKVRRNGEMSFNAISGAPVFADEEAFFDVLKDVSGSGAEFPIEFDQDSSKTFPVIVVIEGTNPNTITGPDDPNAIPGAMINTRQGNKLTVDIALLSRPMSPIDPNLNYAFRLYSKADMSLGEGTFECKFMPTVIEDPVAIDWSVNLWNRVEGSVDDLSPALHDAAGGILDGTTVGTATPDVLWFEFSGGWVFGGMANEPVQIRVDEFPTGGSMLIDLRIEVACLGIDNHYLGFHSVVVEDFFPIGILRNGSLYELTPFDPNVATPSNPFDRLMAVSGSPE